MSLFVFRARDKKGILVKGHMEGEAAAPIKLLLAEQGLIPLHVAPVTAKPNWLPEFNIFKKVKTDEIVLLTRQFYTLFKAGMSMEMLLGTLARQTSNKTLKETLFRIQTDVSEGSTLAHAFGKHPKIFNDLYTQMLAAGEEAGILEEILKNLSELLQKEIDIHSRIKSATLYPKIVVGVLGIASTVMLIWVIPQFAKFYAHYHADLPLPTQILVGASTILVHYGWGVAIAAIILYLLYRRYYNTPSGKLRIDRLFWSVPVFGPLGVKTANARFAHILASLYHSGFSITKSLRLIENILDNEVMIREIRHVQTSIEQGMSIADAMRQGVCFSPIMIESTAIGEQTGSLDEMLKGMGEHYDTEIDHTVKNLTTLIEPFLLFFIFGMVALFALSIFLPIWNMSQAVLHS